MANALLPLAKEGLKWAITEISSSQLQTYFSDGLAHMSDGTDTEHILSKVDEVLGEVQEVKAVANKISQKLDERVLQLQKDTLRHHFETVDSIFEKIRNCTKQAIENRRTIQDPVKLRRTLEVLQIEQGKELQNVVDKIPKQLNHINGYLGNTEFINTAANVALQDSKDFLGYYKRIETLFTAYWGRVLQSIVLLKMAERSAGVLFGEASQTIKEHSEKLAAQVTTFYNVLGVDVCRMAQHLLASSGNPNARMSVCFSSGWGKGIKTHLQTVKYENPIIDWPGQILRYGKLQDPGGTWYMSLKVQDDGSQYKYRLQVATEVSATAFDFTKTYPMRLWDQSDYNPYSLARFRIPDRQNGIKMGTDEQNNKWHIRPVSVGSNNFYFEAVEGYFGDAVLVTGWNQNELEWRTGINFEHGFDTRVDRAYFQLRFGAE